jgi:hypothetical protein
VIESGTTQPEDADQWKAGVHRWFIAATGMDAQRVPWGDSSAPPLAPKDGDYARLRVIGESGQPAWTERRRRHFPFVPVAVSGVSGSDLAVAASCPLQTGDGPARVLGSSPPPPLSAVVDYWVLRPSPTTLRLAASFDDAITGVHVALTGSGALPLSIVSTATTVRAGSELDVRTMANSEMSIAIQIRGRNAESLALRLRVAGQSPAALAVLRASNVGLLSIGPVQNVGAALDQAHYEPRISMIVRFAVTNVYSEPGSQLSSASWNT